MTGPIASARPDDRGPRPEGACPSLVIGVDVPDHRQRRGLRGGRADAHDDAADDELRGVDRDRADDRPAAEDRHADQHQALATEVVAERAEHQHQAGEGQGVAADDPLQLRHVGVQLGLHAREDRTGDRVVEERQKEDREQGGETEVGAETAHDDVARSELGSRSSGRTGSRCRRSCSPFVPVQSQLPDPSRSRPASPSMLSNQLPGPMYGPAPHLRTPATDITPPDHEDERTPVITRQCCYFLGAAKTILKTALSPPEALPTLTAHFFEIRRQRCRTCRCRWCRSRP